MLTQERHRFIHHRLEREGRVVAADLAREFSVSEDTIRRDLREMAAAGLCERVYGGALLRNRAEPFARRLSTHRDVKRRLGRKVASLLPEGSVVFIDGGTTNLAVAEALVDRRDLTVITNAPAIAAALSLASQVELIVIGGRVDRDIGAAVDAEAMAQLDSVRPDIFVAGACGLDPEHGLSVERYDEHVFKRRVAGRSRRIVAALDGSKFDNGAPYAIAPFSGSMTLVCDAALAAEDLSRLVAAGVTLAPLDRDPAR